MLAEDFKKKLAMLKFAFQNSHPSIDNETVEHEIKGGRKTNYETSCSNPAEGHSTGDALLQSNGS